MDLTFKNLLFDNDCLGKQEGNIAESEKNFYSGRKELQGWLDDKALKSEYIILYSDSGKYSFSPVSNETYTIAITKKGEKQFEAYIVKNTDKQRAKSWGLTLDERKAAKNHCITASNPDDLNQAIIDAIKKMKGMK